MEHSGTPWNSLEHSSVPPSGCGAYVGRIPGRIERMNLWGLKGDWEKHGEQRRIWREGLAVSEHLVIPLLCRFAPLGGFKRVMETRERLIIHCSTADNAYYEAVKSDPKQASN